LEFMNARAHAGIHKLQEYPRLDSNQRPSA
jgi:hypothetical protein